MSQSGGWTVIQRRGEPLPSNGIREDFFLDWDHYENGFGNASSDYWLGMWNGNKFANNFNYRLLSTF